MQRMERSRDIRHMQSLNTSLGTTCLKYFERDLDQFCEAMA